MRQRVQLGQLEERAHPARGGPETAPDTLFQMRYGPCHTFDNHGEKRDDGNKAHGYPECS
eukprot:2626814-Prymnesium_polylepis.1